MVLESVCLNIYSQDDVFQGCDHCNLGCRSEDFYCTLRVVADFKEPNALAEDSELTMSYHNVSFDVQCPRRD